MEISSPNMISTEHTKWTIQLSNPSNTNLEILTKLCRETFDKTFLNCYTPEDLQKFFESSYTPAILKSEMENTDKYRFFIVYEQQRMIGFVQLEFHDKRKYECIPRDKTIEIARIYIIEEFFGTGLAQEMMQVVLAQEGYDGIWLGVWEDNQRAQRFYQKFGFERIGEHKFLVGEKVDCDYLFFRPNQG